MKRTVSLLLFLLFLGGCANFKTVQETPSPALTVIRTDGGAPATPAPSGPLRTYKLYKQNDWQKLKSGVMFTYDLDQDGVAEPVSFTKGPDKRTTYITWGESTVVLEEGDEFVSAAVLDLDTGSPFFNLLVVIDMGSDSHVTIELHPENGQLVKGPVINGSWFWEDDALWFYERTDFLGTDTGQRTFSGDGLTPDSEWLTMAYIPTAEELADEEEREWLIEGGFLLHTVRPVPCTVDGQPGYIPADTYVYRVRFLDGEELCEVCLPDGTLAQISCTLGEDGWPYYIDGVEMEEYFDNLFFAD